MDKIIEAIQTHSTSEGEIRHLKTLLAKEEVTLLKNANFLDDALSTIDPTAHSLGYAYILSARVQAGTKIDPIRFLSQAQAFLLNSTTQQIKLVGTKFCQIARRFAEVCIEIGQPIKAVKPLRVALKKLRNTSEALTPIHSDFVLVCLLSKCYSVALPILEEEIYDVSADLVNISYKDVLLYFYYGGLIYIGLKKYKQALVFLRLAITTPASALSLIMVEAYKKLILVTLIVTGKLPSLPRYTSNHIQRYQKSAMVHYSDFAAAFSNHNIEELNRIANANAEAFARDKNLGLVKQCIQALSRRNIQRFTQTYLTFSLQDIATSVGLPSTKEAEVQILKMVENGEIFATINQKDGMVSFGEDPEQYDSSQMTSLIDTQIQRVIDYGRKMRAVDESIASNPIYLQKTSMSDRSGRWSEFDDQSIDLNDKPIMGKLI